MFKKASITTALMAVGVITSWGYSAVAQTEQPEMKPNQAAPNRPVPPTAQPGMNRMPMPMPGQSNQISALDKAFVMDAAHGGMAEVKLAQLALQKSTNPEVKRFAQQMIEQHSKANQELMGIVNQKGMTPPMDVGFKYQAGMMRLMQLSGAEFDRAYLSEAGVNSHLEAAAVYQREASLGLDPELKAFAAKTLPTVQGHLQMASQMTGYRFAQNSPMPGMNMPMARPQSMPPMSGMDIPNMKIPPLSPMPR